MAEQIMFNLNGNTVSATVSPETTLLQYLRNKACLKGTKEGCGTGHCGSCTVLLDGKPVRACITKMSRVKGSHVLTIEGLAPEGQLHSIQAAFLDAGAVQCGFCTPGMVLAVKALLDEHPDPSDTEIKKALKHNYCRCTGYVKIIEAVRLAAARLLEKAYTPQKETFLFSQEGGEPFKGRIVGQALWDADGLAKATGSLAYADDLVVPGMVYGKMVWSSQAHARIISVDIEAAQASEKVLHVFTAKDVPGTNGFGLLKADQPVFCKDQVRFYKDAIALVVAETAEAAQVAAEKVKVVYEALEPVFDMITAEAKGLIHKALSHEVGNVAAAKQEKDLLVLRGHFETPWVEHAYLEPESALAQYAEEEGLLLHAATQSPFELRRQLSAVLNLHQDSIRIIVTPLGGGFGSKADATIEPALAVAAYHLKRPVKLTLTREESLALSTKRHPYQMDYEVGLSKEGLLRYVDAKLLSDGGPYTNLSPRVIDQACIFSVGPYRIPNGKVEGKAVATNNVAGSAFRGFGINQANFAMESLLDEGAEKLGIDPFELRARNAFVKGDATFSGEILRHSIGIQDTIRLCKEATEEALKSYLPHYPQGTKVLGLGMASGFKNVGAGKGKVDDAGAIITLKPDQRIEVRVSGVDMGQGFRTAMLQLATEILEVESSQIDLISGDTELTPHHGNAVGERQTLISGNAVVMAARLFKEKQEMGEFDEKGVLSARFEYVAPKTFALYDVEGRKSVSPEDYRNYPAYAYTTQAAIVEVDTSTGKVKVLKVVAAHDVGRAINPHIIEGQVEGSCSMGIGYALSESFPVLEGQPQVKYYGQLGLPTIEDTPDYLHWLIEDPDPLGPLGAKGVSEVATVPMTPAVINAIHNATGVRIRTLPALPEKILSGLK